MMVFEHLVVALLMRFHHLHQQTTLPCPRLKMTKLHRRSLHCCCCDEHGGGLQWDGAGRGPLWPPSLNRSWLHGDRFDKPITTAAGAITICKSCVNEDLPILNSYVGLSYATLVATSTLFILIGNRRTPITITQ